MYTDNTTYNKRRIIYWSSLLLYVYDWRDSAVEPFDFRNTISEWWPVNVKRCLIFIY
jgi:hypothetical protein